MADDDPVRFNISSPTDTQRFRQFIDDLRVRLRDESRPYVMQDAMRLRQQEDDPTGWLNLELSTSEHTITLRLRTDNLYVVGFRNGAGTWFELRHNDGHASRIPGSTALRVSEGYTGGDNTLELDESVQIGRGAVEEAINALAAYDGTAADKDLKVWLLRLLVRFVESIRLNAIADRPLDGPDTGLTAQLVSLIKKWQKLCNLLLAVANDVVQDPETMARRFQAYAGVGVHNAFELAAALGMVLISNSGRRRQKRSVQDNQDHAVAGLTLVEVADVIVHNIDGEDPGDLYGVIAVDDGSGSQRLFDRDRSDVQSVRPGEQAEITGPGRAVSGADGFAVRFDLMDRDTDPSPDDEVSKEVVVWNPLDATSDEYDVIRSRTVAGKHGLVELRYAVMTDAAVATVEVLVAESSEDVPDVYGTVTTATNLENGTPVTIRLLATGDTERSIVKKGAAIPLLRNVVAVPLCSVLQVTMDLWDRNLVFADEQIANGSVTFPPRLSGKDVQEVSGDKGRVAVHVSWSTWFEFE